MSKAVLPQLSTNDTTAQLPSNPNDLLSASEKHKLNEHREACRPSARCRNRLGEFAISLNEGELCS